MSNYKPVALIILDGWGRRFAHEGNAVYHADTPNFDGWMNGQESSVLDASGEFVGLVAGQMGNSEVGHLNLGAGRVVFQDIVRIDNAVKDRSLKEMLVENLKLDELKANGKKLHITGLLGPGGIHSHDRHLRAILRFLKDSGVRIVIHTITDGRDTPPHNGIEFLKALEAFIDEEGMNAEIATVSGRYYEMDRDKRWDRTRKAYKTLVLREAEKTAGCAEEAIQQSYDDDVTDEFILPTLIEGVEDAAVEEGDAMLFYNFRADRMRQIVSMFVYEDFEPREDLPFVPDLNVVTMTQYEDDLPVTVLFPKDLVENVLAKHLSDHGLKQFHIAETEKYAHVTFFFNGRREEPFAGEDRKLIPSPKVATYDLQPEMSADQVVESVLERLESHDDDFILVNFANPDMVGHTGDMEAAMKAVATVDKCAGRVVDAILEKGGAALITADHGNSELMIDYLAGGPHTYHTKNAVPFFILAADKAFMPKPRGKLADVAPTILELMGLEKPEQMTGESLIEGSYAPEK